MQGNHLLREHGAAGPPDTASRRWPKFPRVPPQRGPRQVGGEASHLLHASAPATWGPGEAWRGAPAPVEEGLSLPWRSSGCTRRLVMVSHRAMISSLSSRPSRVRQPSLSGWLSPDISTPKKGGEDDANNVAPSGPRGRRLGNRHRKCLSRSSLLKGLGIPDPWAEVAANEAIRKRGAPTCGSGLAGPEWSTLYLTLGTHRVYTEDIDLPLGSWWRKAKPRTLQEFLRSAKWKSCAGAWKAGVGPQCTTSSHDAAGPANGGVSSTLVGSVPGNA